MCRSNERMKLFSRRRRSYEIGSEIKYEKKLYSSFYFLLLFPNERCLKVFLFLTSTLSRFGFLIRAFGSSPNPEDITPVSPASPNIFSNSFSCAHTLCGGCFTRGVGIIKKRRKREQRGISKAAYRGRIDLTNFLKLQS